MHRLTIAGLDMTVQHIQTGTLPELLDFAKIYIPEEIQSYSTVNSHLVTKGFYVKGAVDLAGSPVIMVVEPLL